MSKRPLRADDLKLYRHVSEPRLSPDGSRVLFSVKELGEKNKNRVHLFTTDLADGNLKQWTHGEASNSHGRWRPDGSSIAFLCKRGEGPAQIWTLPADGGEAKALTSFPEGSISGFQWSPNGEKIAVLFRPAHPDFTVAASKEREANGGSQPAVVINSLHYRLDGDGYFADQRYALYIVDAQTGEHTLLYDGAKVDHYSYAWASDGSGLWVSHPIFESNPAQEVSNDALMFVPLSGPPMVRTDQPVGEKGPVACSPDGQWIAYLGYASEADERGDLNRRLFVTPTTGGQARCLTENDDFCLSIGVNSDTKSDDGRSLIWSPDSRAVYVQVGRNGAIDLAYVPVDEGGLRFLTEGEHLAFQGDISADGSLIVGTYGTATRLQEVSLYRVGENAPCPLTHFNAAFFDEVEVRAPESLWTDNGEGGKVQLWVIRGAGDGPRPGVLEIHGGPHMMYGYSFMHEFQLLAAEGYTVVYSNPRGSKGYGEAHTMAIRNSWGDKDWVDIQAVTRWMQADAGIDSGRMGVMGGSYGGYMTNWVVGHTHDFKAAITDRCVSNLVSKAGNSDYLWRPNGYWQGYAYGPWEKIQRLWEASPIAYFDQVKTPTLVIHSEGDLRCNIEQGEQVFAALQQRGVPSRFVRYPASTSHGMSRNGPADLRLHRLGEILDWWRRWL